MARFSDVDAFVAVAECGSFRAAAGMLAVTKSTVSRAIQRLEDHLGAALFVRDQHAVRLTDAGTAYLRFARAAFDSLSEGEQTVASLSGSISGTVHISAPPALGQAVLARVCGEFLGAHPKVSLNLVLTDNLVSLTSEPFDLVVRAGPRLRNSDLKARRLARAPMVAVAAPAMAASLWERGVVPLVEFAFPGHAIRDLSRAPLPTVTRFTVNDYFSLREAVLAGHGVGLLSELLVARDIEEGRLLRVLDDWKLPTANYWALFPNVGPMPPRTKALLDHITERFARWSAGPG